MKTITPQQEDRVSELISLGYSSGRIAEMVGVSLAAVDRLSGKAPEPDTYYGDGFAVVYQPPREKGVCSPLLDRPAKPSATATPEPPPVAKLEGEVVGVPNVPVGQRASHNPAKVAPAQDFPPLRADPAVRGGNLVRTAQLICLIDDHEWEWTGRGPRPTTCPQHRGARIRNCAADGHVWVYMSRNREPGPKYCPEHRDIAAAQGAKARWGNGIPIPAPWLGSGETTDAWAELAALRAVLVDAVTRVDTILAAKGGTAA